MFQLSLTPHRPAVRSLHHSGAVKNTAKEFSWQEPLFHCYLHWPTLPPPASSSAPDAHPTDITGTWAPPSMGCLHCMHPLAESFPLAYRGFALEQDFVSGQGFTHVACFMVCSLPDLKRGIWATDEALSSLPTGALDFFVVKSHSCECFPRKAAVLCWMCRLAAGWHWVSLLKDNRAYVFREKEKSYWYNNIMPGRQPCLCNPLWAQCCVVARALFPAEKWLWFAWSRTLSWLTGLQKETACVAAWEARGVHLRGEGIETGAGAQGPFRVCTSCRSKGCQGHSMKLGESHGAGGIPQRWAAREAVIFLNLTALYKQN